MSNSNINIIVNKPSNIDILTEKYTEAIAVILTRKISLASMDTFSDELNNMLIDTITNAALTKEDNK